ncbi:DUF6273 domain-containing protein [Pseudoflavonifractor sp. CLA-AP-H29]|uniref:DUF6273 domain-containing protein n=1 Tax=Pseudoflavonifractor intestinihominis TaxID=3133171 RepID=A0ABV1EAX8_9FIRM
MKPKSRILSLLLAICLVAGLMPTTAFAADGDKTIMLGTSGISGYDSTKGYDYIYYGNWSAPDNHTTSGPIKWRVLDDQTNTGGTGLFLLSDVLLGSGTNGGVYFDESSPYSSAWHGSNAQTWCQNFCSDNFSTGEQSAVLATTKSDDGFTSSTCSFPFEASENILNGDKVFFLSAQEAENDGYGFTDDAARIACYGDSAGVWWLRSPRASNISDLPYAGVVHPEGYVTSYLVNKDRDARPAFARPAFNLNLTSVLFTSAAAGGKSANGMDSGLTAIGNYADNEWKLTLLDKSRSFAVTEQTVSGAPGGTITLNYTGATTGTNEYISVIIADSNGSTLYYGRVAQPDSANGQVEIKIPDSLAAGKYTLNVFSEQYNGDYMTDYASAFAEVALTVEEAAAPGIDTGKAIQLVDSGTVANISGGQADNIYFGTYQQSSDGSTEPDGTEGVDWIKSDTANKNGQGPYYYIDPVKWRVLSNASGQLFLLSDQNLDVFQYHTDSESVTWEKSTMRSWLNGYGASENIGGDSGTDYTSDNFIGTAFSEKEQGAIADTTVVNDDNGSIEGGNNTDKIFLLSIAEAQNSSYFADNSSRIATNTAYVAGGGKIGGDMYGVGEADNWWLRSPGNYDKIAALVTDIGGVGSNGGIVFLYLYAVRPAFNLDLESVLFTSAAAGGKSASGMDSGLTAIGNYDGNEWKLTLLDSTRNFSISNAVISNNTITFSYSDAETGTNEYISAVIVDNGAITYYGRILQLDGTTNGASGTASLTIPAGVTLDNDTKLYVFNEQYNGEENDDTKLTDYASQLIDVLDTTAPTLTAGTATRTSETSATVKFTSSEAGTYYYAVVESGDTAPTIDTTGDGTTCISGPNTISISDLTDTAAKDIYIVAKDAAGNVSQSLKIEIPAYTVVPKTYTLTVDLNGGSGGTTGGTTGGTYPAGEVVNINAGSRSNYRFNGWTSSDGGTFADASSASTTFTMPAADTTITANWRYIGGGGSTTDYYRLTFETNGGSEISSIRRAEYTTIDLTDYTPTREGYEFTGWYADENLTEKITSIRLTRNTTVYAGWEEIKENPGTGFENPFTDVSENDWFFNDVKFVYQNGLMNGTSATTFSPEGTTSRGMIVTILWRMAGSPDMEDKIWGYPFADVDATAYYGTAVYWARLNGIAGGYDDATFGPNAPINREQMAVMMYRYAQYMGYDTTQGGMAIREYADYGQVSSYALEAMDWANATGIVTGTSESTLSPQGQATRAQAAAMFTRFCEQYAEK